MTEEPTPKPCEPMGPLACSLRHLFQVALNAGALTPEDRVEATAAIALLEARRELRFVQRLPRIVGDVAHALNITGRALC